MAKRMKKLEAVIGFTKLIEEPDRRKARLMSRQSLEASSAVKAALEYYEYCVRDFKLSRNLLVQAKEHFQDTVDEKLSELGRIAKSKYWEFEITEDGNMLYKDSEQSYTIKAKNYRKRNVDKETVFDGDINWGEETTNTGTGETPSVPSGYVRPPFLFKDAPQAWIDTYVRINTKEEKLQFYKEEILEDDENQFMALLIARNNNEAIDLYEQFSDTEKQRIKPENRP